MLYNMELEQRFETFFYFAKKFKENGLRKEEHFTTIRAFKTFSIFDEPGNRPYGHQNMIYWGWKKYASETCEDFIEDRYTITVDKMYNISAIIFWIMENPEMVDFPTQRAPE